LRFAARTARLVLGVGDLGLTAGASSHLVRSLGQLEAGLTLSEGERRILVAVASITLVAGSFQLLALLLW
jgi:hypothetical protein